MSALTEIEMIAYQDRELATLRAEIERLRSIVEKDSATKYLIDIAGYKMPVVAIGPVETQRNIQQIFFRWPDGLVDRSEVKPFDVRSRLIPCAADAGSEVEK